MEPARVTLEDIRKAVAGAGYSVPEAQSAETEVQQQASNFNRSIMNLLGIVFGALLLIVVVGEWMGVLKQVSRQVPWYVWLVVIGVGGFPVFRNVARAAIKGQVISHTLMTTGVIASILVGEWATAAVVVFFMRIGDYTERYTTERSRNVLRDLTAMSPRLAHLERNGAEVDAPLTQVAVGDVVVVRPGEMIPVDGVVISGQATVDQAAVTGESMPVEIEAGAGVFAASLARLGSLRVRVTAVGAGSTFGHVIRLVEEAEAHRANVQRVADKFSAYYLPVVGGVAALTFLLRRDPLATAAVLVVACSCSFALATPIAMLASIGAGAKRGLLFKGGKYLETLARAGVVLVDKTGTLTFGEPQIERLLPLDGRSENELLALAAAVERYSEHPLAGAVRKLARQRQLPLQEVRAFAALPGSGVSAALDGHRYTIGNRRVLEGLEAPALAAEWEAQGKTLLYMLEDEALVGLLAAVDTVRPETPLALARLRSAGIHTIELLTGDHPAAAAGVASQLGIAYRAGLLPEEKIAVVKEYQAQGHVVVMVGDGINDAPALAQADVGIAMGAAGSDIAIEAAHVALMRQDWMLVPEAVEIARRTMGVVKMNIAFTAIYNLLGLTLAALGFLPPMLAAAAQSLPDLGILANSSRLLKQKTGK